MSMNFFGKLLGAGAKYGDDAARAALRFITRSSDNAAMSAARGLGLSDDAAKRLVQSRRALPAMSRVGEVSRIAARPAGARTVGAAMDAAAAARPGVFRRVAGSVGKGGPVRKWGKRGLMVGGVEAILNAATGAGPIERVYNALSGGPGPSDEYDLNAILGALPAASKATSQAEQFRQFLADNPYGGTKLPDYVGDADAAAAASRASLNDYLAANRAYGEANAQQVADLYQQMSQNLMQSSGDVFQRGQVTAADIDRLYEQLAAENLGTAYGEGLATPTSDVAGLAAPSGTAATGGETARTYGASLADYLGQEAGIESAALEQIAGSQALQGAALAQSLRDYIAMAEADKRFMVEQELAAQRAGAQARRDEMLLQDMENRRAYQREAAQQEFGFEAIDRETAAAEEQVARDAATRAAYLWVAATTDQRKKYSELVGGATGQDGLNKFVDLVYRRPEIMNVLGA